MTRRTSACSAATGAISISAAMSHLPVRASNRGYPTGHGRNPPGGPLPGVRSGGGIFRSGDLGRAPPVEIRVLPVRRGPVPVLGGSGAACSRGHVVLLGGTVMCVRRTLQSGSQPGP
ncbi:hypothetical protein [Amycolatopsis sp. NPDC021455]|uniref:hypothetical protein n=1 Tax=Amycolatopsis sp. NPDC021455 TaxID=3154901 RepID=UPI0033EE1F25